MGKNLIRFINKEDIWLEIPAPSKLHSKTMNFVEAKIARNIYMLKLFKYAAISFFSISIVLSAVIVTLSWKPIQMVFVYPHSENIQSVSVEWKSSRTQKTKEVPLVLDEKKGVWEGVVHTRNKNLNDYVIKVEEIDTNTTSDDPNVEENSSVGI